MNRTNCGSTEARKVMPSGRLLVLAVALGVAMACSETTNEPGVRPSLGRSETGQRSYTPDANGKQVSEADACQVIVAAFSERATSLGCAAPMPACPDLLRVNGYPACGQFDEGTVQGCASNFRFYQACSDFAEKSCVLVSTPPEAGCPIGDAGADSGDSALGQDAVDVAVESDASLNGE